MDFKPLNVQFEVEDEKTVDELTTIAAAVAKQRADRRLRVANIAKEILLGVLRDHRELLDELLEFHADDRGLVAAEQPGSYDPSPENGKTTSPKSRRKRQPTHQAAP